MKKTLLALLLAAAASAQAAPTFVGSYAVFDGPFWGENPAVYSGREAAALIFGGSFTDYAISISSSLDFNTITHTAWYDGWGEHNGMIFAEDYKLDVGAPGYNAPGGGATAHSAYVRDGLFDTEQFRNYVWRLDAANDVPEPGALALLGLGFAGLGALRRRQRSLKQD